MSERSMRLPEYERELHSGSVKRGGSMHGRYHRDNVSLGDGEIDGTLVEYNKTSGSDRHEGSALDPDEHPGVNHDDRNQDASSEDRSEGEKDAELIGDWDICWDLNNFLSPGYKESLFDCWIYPGGCALSVCAPCCPMSSVKAQVDDRPVTFLDMCCCVPNQYQTRQTMRRNMNLELHPVQDCLATTCCFCCAVHQDVREYARHVDEAPEFMPIPRV